MLRAQIPSYLEMHTIFDMQVDFSSLGAFMEASMERQKHNYTDDDDALYEVNSIIAVKRNPFKKKKKEFLYLATFKG